MESDFSYLAGFGNHHQSEALPGALPVGQNSPQKPKYGLYAEQFSGTAFTMPREQNLRSWLYRIRPSVCHDEFSEAKYPRWESGPLEVKTSPQQLRWDPPNPTKETVDFVGGITTVAANGSVHGRWGGAVHVYICNRAMGQTYFYNVDGEMLVVPQRGRLLFRTEMGPLDVGPGEILLLPRGMKFQVEPIDKDTYGYVCENYGQPFRLPYLGVIGANSSADPRDFLAPAARYEDRTGDFRVTCKFEGNFWTADLSHSPLDVVAWHGNYTPYKYNLARFQAIGTVSVDHPDPSIWTVLTSPSPTAGTANLDFVIFPPRWLVAENTFRPPYYHRNSMSEFMGLITGVYDAKLSGFAPGGYSLHNAMTPHGPDAEAYEGATNAKLEPQKIDGTLAFMFESAYPFHPTSTAVRAPNLQKEYLKCWKNLKSHFNPKEVGR
jgi:homogentisate 1,2-dioxygenase